MYICIYICMYIIHVYMSIYLHVYIYTYICKYVFPIQEPQAVLFKSFCGSKFEPILGSHPWGSGGGRPNVLVSETPLEPIGN